MNNHADCTVVIPCFNEQATIASVVSGARRHVEDVIVVDDGSTDETATNAQSAGAEVVGHVARRGKGAALKTGLTQAHARGFKWALAMDGDGQHSPADIPRFFECAQKDDAALVIGNRMDNAEKIPWLRRAVNRAMSRILSRMGGQHFPDSQCGFRLINLKTWAALRIGAKRFEVESELLLAFVHAKHTVRFVPVEVIYRDEESKIRPLRDTLRWLRWLQRVRRSA